MKPRNNQITKSCRTQHVSIRNRRPRNELNEHILTRAIYLSFLTTVERKKERKKERKEKRKNKRKQMKEKRGERNEEKKGKQLNGRSFEREIRVSKCWWQAWNALGWRCMSRKAVHPADRGSKIEGRFPVSSKSR